jgi:hypothetical protein
LFFCIEQALRLLCAQYNLRCQVHLQFTMPDAYHRFGSQARPEALYKASRAVY